MNTVKDSVKRVLIIIGAFILVSLVLVGLYYLAYWNCTNKNFWGSIQNVCSQPSLVFESLNPNFNPYK